MMLVGIIGLALVCGVMVCVVVGLISCKIGVSMMAVLAACGLLAWFIAIASWLVRE